MNVPTIFFSDSSTPPRPTPVPRGPLPPFDHGIHPHDSNPPILHTTVPSGLVIPVGPDKGFMRADAWAVEVAGGLPFVPGGTSSKFPNRCLTWFLNEYQKRDAGSVDRILDSHALRGYTHYVMSRGGGFGNQPPVAYAAQAAYVASWGFWVVHQLSSKDIDPWPIDNQASVMFTRVQPYLDALLSVGDMRAITQVSLGWELNAFWNPNELQKFKEMVYNYIPRQVVIASHFTTYATAWQLDGHPRADYYADGIVKSLWYQTNPFDFLRYNQAHANDAMVPASGLQTNGVTLVAFEVYAASQFDGPATEDTGNMQTFGLMCTPGPIPFYGFAGGTRYPDGRIL